MISDSIMRVAYEEDSDETANSDRRRMSMVEVQGGIDAAGAAVGLILLASPAAG